MGAKQHDISIELRRLVGDRAECIRVALDSKLDAVAVLGKGSVHLDVNARLTALLGFEPEQILGKTPPVFGWPHALQTAISNLLDSAPEFAQKSLRTSLPCKGDHSVEVLAELTRYAVDDTVIVLARFRELGEDFAARTLRESEERYRALAEYSPYGIIVHTGGTMQYVNPAAAKMWGGDVEDLRGQSILGWVHPDYREEVMARIATMIGHTHSAPTLREKLLRRDGTTFFADVQGTPIPFNGKPAIQLVIRDVTEETDREARLAQAERLEAIGNLTSSVAHDFNNLLTVVISACALAARRSPDNEALQRDLKVAQLAAKRGGALTKQLLAFGRKQDTQSRAVFLGTVIEEISMLISKLLGEAIHWTLTVDPDLWPCRANALQVEQVVMNLASNAKTAMPNGGTLTICAQNVELGDAFANAARAADLPRGRYVELRVTDTGIGMDAKTKEHIFEKSFTTGADTGGSGLGLATVYSIVKGSGGAIHVESEPGAGATFTIYLPAAAAIREVPEAPKDESEPVRGSETILCIEDQERVRAATRAVLEVHGYRVVEADGVRSARALLGDMSQTIDLIVSDVMLSDGTGPQIVEEALAAHPHLPVLYVSGYATTEVLSERTLSADAPVLAKPFLPTELCAHVRRLLTSKQNT